jgi:phytoene synthase
VPSGTARYWSWWFAAREARDPLLGVYALVAECRALMEPGLEQGVTQGKLAWWREELARLAAGSPLHPITRYLADLPRATAADFTPLDRSVEAVAAQVAGVPLERAAEFEPHAADLYGAPLLAAARLAGARGDVGLDACLRALAAGEYLARALTDYGRQARGGRIVFPIDELLAAGIGNEDLTAGEPTPTLRAYLEALRRRAADYFTAAGGALRAPARPALRHLPVLAALGARRLRVPPRRAEADFRPLDLYNAWTAARRAARAR